MKPLDLLHVDLAATHLIEASAGTGKTYTIASLFVRLLLQARIPIHEILVVTYTVPATDELKTRIRAKLRDAVEAFTTGASTDSFLASLLEQVENRAEALNILRDSLSGFDEAAISTIHGFCQRMLKELAFETGSPFDLELVTDQAGMLLDAADDFYRLHMVQETTPELVAYAMSKKVSPEFFLKLAGKSNLAAKVIPDLDKPSLEPHLGTYRQTFSELCDQWGICCAEIEGVLSDRDTFKQNIYKLENVPSYILEIDRFLASGGTELPLPKEVVKLSQASVRNGVKKGKTVPEHPFFMLCEILTKAASALTAAMDAYLTWLKVAFHEFLHEDLPGRKAKQGLVHFDDLLLRMHGALESPMGLSLAQAVGKRFKAALIDEFQDTDPLQYDIFTKCFSECPLFLIGDPKQAVYSFRGADIFTYKKAADNVDKSLKNTLVENWRSEPGLIDAVNALFEKANHPFVYPWIEFREAHGADKPDRKVLAAEDKANLVVWFMGSGDIESLKVTDARRLLCRAVAHEISKLLNGARQGRVKLGKDELKPSGIAVLVRENTQARAMRDALRSCSIPCVLFSDENVFFSQEAFEMAVLLHALAEPDREAVVKTALMSGIFGLSALEISGLMEDDKAWEGWITKFREHHDLWNKAGFTPAFRRLMDQEGVRTRLLAGERGERVLTNVLHLSELMGNAEVKGKLGMQGLLKWLAERRDPDMPSEEEYQLRLESDDDAVRIMTVHKSKGLEFPVVFCPFAWSPVKPGRNAPLFHNEEGSAVMDFGSADLPLNTARAEHEALAENVRLLYVALTRAKNRCYMAWGRVKDAETSAVSYLIRSRAIARDENQVEALRLVGFDENSMKHELENHIEGAKAHAVIRDIPMDAPQPLAIEALPAEGITALDFSTAIDRSWGIASYTMFIHGLHEWREPADRDMLAPAVQTDEEEGTQEGREAKKDIFSFPRGARAGTLLHEVFEWIDFTADNTAVRAVVDETLGAHGFEGTWAETVTGMVRRVLDVDLGRILVSDPGLNDGGVQRQGRGTNPVEGIGALRLSGIANSERLSELEFMFPLKQLTAGILEQAITDCMPSIRIPSPLAGVTQAIPGLRPSGAREVRPIRPSCRIVGQGEGVWLPAITPRLVFDPVKGFLRGFMDLVFLHQGKYYLIDWKSNHLGGSVEDYGQDALLQSMIRDNYILQYHLYCVALHQYFMHRMEGYSYKEHFGGVFYVFLRGVDPEKGPEYGIFHARPNEENLMKLSEVLIDKEL